MVDGTAEERVYKPQDRLANERASEPTRAEWGSRGPASARLRQGCGEVSPKRSREGGSV
jgi:hypothetical protein